MEQTMGIQADAFKFSSPSISKSEDWLIGARDVGKLIRSVDWAKTL